MSFFETRGIGIAGIACAVPDHYVTVDSFIPTFGEEVTSKFTAGVGIEGMNRALPEQTAGDLAFAAAENLFSQMPVERDKIGALVLVTQSGDYRRPSTACVLQHRLGLSTACAAVEVNLGCSGFVYGMQTAMSLMAQSDMEYALLLLGETASKLAHPQDKSVAMMYGDAGAAVLLKRDPEASSRTMLFTDGGRFKAIVLPAGGFRDMNPPADRFMCHDGIERSLYDIYMEGTSVFSFSISDVPKSIQQYFEKTGTSAEDYDLFLFHQANRFIIRQLAKKLKLPPEKVPVSLDRYGNTGGISVPITLCANCAGKETGTRRLFMAGFGIGLSWGVTDAVIDMEHVFPVVKTSDWFKEGKITPEMLQ